MMIPLTEMELVRVNSLEDVRIIAGGLIDLGVYFEVMPLPDEWWEIRTRAEGHLIRVGVDPGRVVKPQKATSF